jgi:hypothetical protein
MSTMPAFQGGLQPIARVETDEHRIRESIDPDDYASQFALWSGTSFSAPLFAGRLAKAIGPVDPAHDTRAEAVTRGWAAVAALTDIAP